MDRPGVYLVTDQVGIVFVCGPSVLQAAAAAAAGITLEEVLCIQETVWQRTWTGARNFG